MDEMDGWTSLKMLHVTTDGSQHGPNVSLSHATRHLVMASMRRLWPGPILHHWP